MQRLLLIVLAILPAALTAFAADPPAPQRGVTENDGLALATLDSRLLNEADALFTRYVWIEEGDLENYQGLSLAANLLGDDSLPHKPALLGKDKLMVARIDLRDYADSKRLNDIIRIWEEFQFDPKFNLLVTEDTIRFLSIPNFTVKKSITVKEWVQVKPYVHTDGKTYEWKQEQRTKIAEVPFKEAKVQVARQTSEHIDQAAFAELVSRLQTQAPIVSWRYFLFRSMSTIQDDGVFKTIFGGLYYELAGFKESKDPKVADIDLLFESLGVGNTKAGITAEKIFADLPSDKRIAIFRSLVTGKPRMAEVLPTLAGIGRIISVTHDIKDKNIDIGSDPVMNLLKFKDDAREVIFEKVNGLHGFAAFDGNGKLQREVPFDVANDTTIPHPHTQRLQSAISCIRCHGNEGGWRVLTNDVQKLLGGYLDIFGDNAVRRPVPDTVRRLAGLYSGNLEREHLGERRDKYAASILRTTGAWKRSKVNQTDIVQLASAKLGEVYNAYWYESVDARKALKELGFPNVKDEDALPTLRALLPPVNVVIDGVIPEDPRIAALLAGLSINRYQFELVYSFLATRVQRTLKAGGK